MNKLRYSKLLKRFRGSVYNFRQHLHQSSFHDKTITIDRIRIFKNGKRSRKKFDAMNKALKWPLRKNSDPIFDRIKELGLIKMEHINARIQHKYQRVCPVDGVVTPKVAEIKSPDWTWGALCGRGYTYWVCPHCLYKFSGGLVSMS